MEQNETLPEYSIWVVIMFFVALMMWAALFMVFGIMIQS